MVALRSGCAPKPALSWALSPCPHDDCIFRSMRNSCLTQILAGFHVRIAEGPGVSSVDSLPANVWLCRCGYGRICRSHLPSGGLHQVSRDEANTPSAGPNVSFNEPKGGETFESPIKPNPRPRLESTSRDLRAGSAVRMGGLPFLPLSERSGRQTPDRWQRPPRLTRAYLCDLAPWPASSLGPREQARTRKLGAQEEHVIKQ